MISKNTDNYHIEVFLNVENTTVFTALTKQLESWWGKVDTSISKVGDTFTIHFGKAFWTFNVVQYDLNSKLIWECIDGQPSLEKEWVGTILQWELKPHANNSGSVLNFTHNGLTPDFECYDICAPTWTRFLNESLKNFLESGKGMPHID